MIRQTIVGLAALVASCSAVQSSQWYGSQRSGGYNGGYGGHYGGGYGSGFGQPSAFSSFAQNQFPDFDGSSRLQRDVSYLVKQNSALKTRLEAAEAAIVALQAVPPVDTAPLEARILALETKQMTLMTNVSDNDSDISALDVRVSDNEGDITVLDMMVCDNMTSIGVNTAKIAANMMSISSNSVAIANQVIDPAIIAQITANSTKINANMMSISQNVGSIGANTGNIGINTAALNSLSMVSTSPAFLAALQTGISTNSNNIAANSITGTMNAGLIGAANTAASTNSAAIVANAAQDAIIGSLALTNQGGVAANSALIGANAGNIATNTGNVATNTAGVATNSGNISMNMAGIATNAAGVSSTMQSLGFITFQVVDNLTSNIVQDQNIQSNTAAVAAHIVHA